MSVKAHSTLLQRLGPAMSRTEYRRMKTEHLEIVATHLEAALQGEPALSFKNPLSLGLIRSIPKLTALDCYHLGVQVQKFLLARQEAASHAEREIRIMRDNSKPLC